jgi:hypothetical protein
MKFSFDLPAHIDKGLIKYFLKNNVNATDDSFTFDVTDKGK